MTQVKYYLPIEADSFEETKERLCYKLSRTFGGFTVYEAFGGWVDDNGDIIEEPVIIIESYTDQSPTDIDIWCEYQAKDMKEKTNEDSIMYTINSEAYFV